MTKVNENRVTERLSMRKNPSLAAVIVNGQFSTFSFGRSFVWPSFWPLFAPKPGRMNEILAGPAYAKFRLTLHSRLARGSGGAVFYEQNVSGQTQWAIPPFFCRTLTPEVDWSEWEVFIRS
jgi:hypothetical protein